MRHAMDSPVQFIAALLDILPAQLAVGIDAKGTSRPHTPIVLDLFASKEGST